MGFLFFGKKKSDVNKALDHVNQISENLKHSFIRIKTDIKVVRDWLSFFKTRDEEYVDRFKNMESRIEEISQVMSYLAERENNPPRQQKPQESSKEKPYYHDETEKLPPRMERTPMDDLTETQKAIFFRLGAFQRESGQEWTALKTLASDLYPSKSYDKVRSTVSEYIGILVDAGFIHKLRKGKQTYLAITEKGKTYFKTDEVKQPKKIEPKTK
ncbi:hypothetical protein HOF78_03930 [Candidatus Woesearchaeota archaeon]|jgi:hypothetical protein|nr:hypothetical protein [Candidatus Woesearchaeota archaeon]MBT6044614.1 hypothetical protein [Candidatus Woesearchaeota archaeon]